MKPLLVALLVASPVLAADPATTCLATKMARAGAYEHCLLKSAAKAVKTESPADSAKCDAKFAAAWAKAETNGGDACPTSGDVTTIGDQVRADVAAIIAAL